MDSCERNEGRPAWRSFVGQPATRVQGGFGRPTADGGATLSAGLLISLWLTWTCIRQAFARVQFPVLSSVALTAEQHAGSSDSGIAPQPELILRTIAAGKWPSGLMKPSLQPCVVSWRQFIAKSSWLTS